MTKKFEYKLVYYHPDGGESLTWAGGDTIEEVNADVDEICRRNNWNKKYLSVIQEKDPETGKWYWR